MGGVTVIAAIALGEWLVSRILGYQFILTGVLLPWMLILVVPYFWANMFSNMIVAHGKYWNAAFCDFSGALTFTLSAVPLISTYGIFGVVSSLGLGLTVLNAVQLVVLRKYNEIELSKTIGRPAVAVALSVLVAKMTSEINIGLSLFSGLFMIVALTLVMGLIEKQEMLLVKGWLVARGVGR